MSLYLSKRARERVIDRYTPPTSIDEPVRASRVPDAACGSCGAIHQRHVLGTTCGSCGAGVVERLPAERWEWCRACSGRGACCTACGWQGVVVVKPCAAEIERYTAVALPRQG